MSRRKMNVLVILSIVILYALSGYLSYDSARDYNFKSFQHDMLYVKDEAKSDYLQKIMDGECEDESMQDIIFNIGSIYEEYPSAAAIYDSDGNKLTQNESCIICNDFDGAIPVEEYLTDEIKSKISDVGGAGLYYEIYRFEYYASDDDKPIIPVSMSIRSMVNQEDKSLTVKLADVKPTNVIDVNDEAYRGVDGMIMQLYLYNNYGDDNFSQNCRKAIDIVNNADIIRNCIKELGEGEFNVSTTDGYTISCLKFPDGKYYYLITSVMYDADYYTFISMDYKNQMLSLTLLYAFAGLVILIAINKLYSKNKKLNETRQAFTSAAAHELKTPITIINNQCECLLKNVSPEKNGEYISNIYKQNNRMAHLVSGLLQYNRLSDKAKLNKTEVYPEKIINDELEKYDALIENNNITIEKNICDNAMIHADCELISLVIDNFLSNAVKYTCKDNKIKITVKKTAEGYRFAVFNSGYGIKPEYAGRIWELFNRSYGEEDDNSTGMGLAICKKILDLHGYRYGFDNKADGVEFYFTAK